MQLVVGCSVRVLHRDLSPELNVLANSCPKLFIAGYAGCIESSDVQLDESLALFFGDLEFAVHGDQVVKATQFAGKPVQAGLATGELEQ